MYTSIFFIHAILLFMTPCATRDTAVIAAASGVKTSEIKYTDS